MQKGSSNPESGVPNQLLESGVQHMNYYLQYVRHYAAWAEPLNILKVVDLSVVLLEIRGEWMSSRGLIDVEGP